MHGSKNLNNVDNKMGTHPHAFYSGPFCKDNIVIMSCRDSSLLGCGAVSFVEYFLTVLRNVTKILPNRTASHSLKTWIFNITAVRTTSVTSHNTVLTHLASFWICSKLCDSCLRFPSGCCPRRTLTATLHHWRILVSGFVSLTCGKLLLASLSRSVRMGQLGFDWTDFHEIWYFTTGEL